MLRDTVLSQSCPKTFLMSQIDLSSILCLVVWVLVLSSSVFFTSLLRFFTVFWNKVIPVSTYIFLYQVRQQLIAATDSSRDVMAEGSEDTKQHMLMLQRKSMMVHLPCREYEGNASSECTICMENFKTSEIIRSLPCFHSFHQTCIDDWLSRSFTCPSCLEPINSALLLSYDMHR